MSILQITIWLSPEITRRTSPSHDSTVITIIIVLTFDSFELLMNIKYV